MEENILGLQIGIDNMWLLIAGFGAHLAGDLITKDGIPLFWPLKNRVALKLFRTGSWVESVLGMILLGLNGLLIYEFWQRFGLSEWSYWGRYLS